MWRALPFRGRRLAGGPPWPEPPSDPPRGSSKTIGNGDPPGRAAAHRATIAGAGPARTPCCRATCSSCARRSRPSPCASSSETNGLPGAALALGDLARRGAGRSGPRRRRGWSTRLAQVLHAIAEHSMCQPGRPGPQGCPTPARRASGACHSTKSSGSRLCGSSGKLPRSLATVQHPSCVRLAEEPAEVAVLRALEVDAALLRRRAPFSISRCTDRQHLGDVPRSPAERRRVEVAAVARHARVKLRVLAVAELLQSSPARSRGTQGCRRRCRSRSGRR